MGFYGVLSLFGVYFLNLIFSYSDDIVLALVVSLIEDYTSADLNSIYTSMPTYLFSFIVKTCANIGMLYWTSKYYSGWNAHRQFKIAERKAAKAEAASPFSFAL